MCGGEQEVAEVDVYYALAAGCCDVERDKRGVYGRSRDGKDVGGLDEGCEEEIWG